MKTKISLRRSLRRQKGFVLITALIFLVILTLLGISSMQASTLQERMAGNLSDRNIALQAAELALRDAERDLGALKQDGTTFCAAGTAGCRPTGARAAVEADRVGFWAWGAALRQSWTPDCTLGQCDSSDKTTATAPVWDDTQANWAPQTGSTGSNPTVKYGTYTGAPEILGLAQQPRYILEIFPANPNDVMGTGGSEKVIFRITVRAVGRNPNTVVVLQSVSMPQ
jgi:type IV pilus assembly protein PilX